MAAFRFTITQPGKKPFEQQTGPHHSAYAAHRHLASIHPEGTTIEHIKPNEPAVASAVTIPVSPIPAAPVETAVISETLPI